jgi:hypothetical protein
MDTQETRPESVDTSAGGLDPSVEVLGSSMRIHDLCIEKPAILEYLQHVSPDKYDIAIIHALEVGVKEIMARRERR